MSADQAEEIARLRKRVTELEAENARLVNQLAHLRTSTMPPLWGGRAASGGPSAFAAAASSSADSEGKSRPGSRSATTSPVRALRPQSSPAVPATGSLLDGPPSSASLPFLQRSHSLGETLLGPAAAALSALAPAAAVTVPDGHVLCDVWYVGAVGGGKRSCPLPPHFLTPDSHSPFPPLQRPPGPVRHPCHAQDPLRADDLEVQALRARDVVAGG
jgi:hypothetical protein